MPVIAKNWRLLVLVVAVALSGAGAAGPLSAAESSKLSAPPAAAPAMPRGADADSETYDRCLHLANKDPGAARDLAERWHDRGGAHPADHCFAVALVGLKQYKEAATRLEALGQAMTKAPNSLRADVLAQAAQAWLLAGDPAHAYAADGAALSLRPDASDLLVDRAEAAGSAGWLDKAIADLDRVLRASPDRVDALIYRASAYRESHRLDPALADIEHAVKLAPDSVPALLERGNIRALRGDTQGARGDWVRVAMLAPGSSAETAAKANIERLETGQINGTAETTAPPSPATPPKPAPRP